MPCSCGNSSCPCGIPCCCSEESCKCQTCAIALSNFCEICNKPLITERQTDVDKCSCFIRESTALISENRGNPRFQMGSMPMPVGYFVSGKLMVNVMIPVPASNFPQLMPQQSVCLIPPSPTIQADSGNILPPFISDEIEEKSLCPKENSSSLPTSESHQCLNKSNELSGNSADRPDHSARIFPNGEQITKISCPETCPSQEFLQVTNESVNVVQNTEPEKENGEISSTDLHQMLENSSEQTGNHSFPFIFLNDEKTGKTSSKSAFPRPEFSQSTDKNHSVNIVRNTKSKIKGRDDELSRTKSYKLLEKSSGQSSNHPSPKICLNGEQTAETSSENACPPQEFSQATNENQIVNTALNKKSATKEQANIQDPSLYLPSITIGNISHPVGLADPIWRLPIPAFSSADNSDSSLNLHNPFYFSELVNATETVATHKKDCCLLVPVINSEGNGTQFFTKVDKNVQTDSTISLQMNDPSLNQSKMSEQSNAVNDNKYAEFTVSSNVSEGNECVAPNPIILPEGCEILTNYSMSNQEFPAISTEISTSSVQTQPLCVVSTSASGQSNYQQSCPTNDSPTFWYPFQQFLSSESATPNIQEHLIPNQTSEFPMLFTPCNINNRESGNPRFVSEMNLRNTEDSAFHNSIPLYIDPSTTHKMEKLLKSALRLNVSSPTLSENSS